MTTRESIVPQLGQRLRDTLGPTDCSVWLFGSLARGDWDGFLDTDLLVLAASQDKAERAADRQGEALLGDVVLSTGRTASKDGLLPLAPLAGNPRLGLESPNHLH